MTNVASNRSSIRSIAAFMALSIFVIAALAFWDQRRESKSALDDFAREQATLARGIAAGVADRIVLMGDTALSRPAVELLAPMRSIEQPGALRLLLARPDREGLSTTEGRDVREQVIEDAIRAGSSSVRLDRERAPIFGLPQRTGVVGLSSFDGPKGRWTVVVVATALRERDRELRAEWRSLVAVLVVSALVLVFGGLLVRKQRKELELSRELEVSALEREREEQLVRIDKLATLAALSTGIAHEVSTPLGVIVGRAEQLLSKVQTDERAKKSVESIIEQGNRIDGIVRGFLTLARGESPPLERVNPAKIVDAASELVDHRFDKAGVRLRVTMDGSLPEISCDPRLLEQVVINLLLNACDACDRGGSVELALWAGGEHVGFVVTDDGAGITAEAAAQATEPFFTTKPAGQGTGLGLAIAAEIVKHHGGRLSIAPRSRPDGSTPGRGTRASVELPVAKENS